MNFAAECRKAHGSKRRVSFCFSFSVSGCVWLAMTEEKRISTIYIFHECNRFHSKSMHYCIRVYIDAGLWGTLSDDQKKVKADSTVCSVEISRNLLMPSSRS